MKWWLCVVLLSAFITACASEDPCEGVPCSEGRVCVLRERKVSCEHLDAGVP
jgi:hypothetical protein